MKKKAIYFSVILLFLISCKKNQEAEPIELGDIENHTITLEQAQKIAELQSMLTTVSKGSNGLRVNTMNLSKRKTVQDTKAIKGEQKDPSFYIINYNGGGFIIVAGDDRSYPILAQSETGSFPTKEGASYPGGLVSWLSASDNQIKTLRQKNLELDPGVKEAWSAIRNQSQYTIAVSKDDNHATNSLNKKKVNDVDPQLPDCNTEGEVVYTLFQRGPLVQSTWAQWEGYNDALAFMGCSSYSNGKPPTGCVATSTAQIMRYYQRPTSLNWSNMPLSYPTSTTAALMADIGYHVNMDYDCDGSGADTEDAATALRNNYGYSSAIYNGTYNYTTVENELSSNRPVILGGGRKAKWLFFNVYADGHAWVADGVQRFAQNTCHVWWDGNYWTQNASWLYFHMNWGWGGQYDGWYGFMGFNPGSNDFNYGTKMITNIRP